MTELKRTSLFPVYALYGAKTIDFGGWEMPVQFDGILKEHEAVRQRAGLFDVSHMGEFRVSGADAESLLQYLTVNDVSKLVPGKAQYTLMCYRDGGVVDDLLIYKLDDGDYMLVVNAANREKDWDWISQHAQGDVRLVDESDATALLALQGPRAEMILRKLTDAPIDALKPFRFIAGAPVGDVTALVARTGYTGEDGFECYVAAEDAINLWECLLDAGREEGLVPIGLGARDTLRFEAGLPLYGQEIAADISPVEAGLGFFVKPDKGDFIGKTVLEDQKRFGPTRRLVGLEMRDRGIPRPGYKVLAGEEEIGHVTTGTQSPTLKKNVGLALVNRQYGEIGTEVQVDVRGRSLAAVVVKTPFYKRVKG